MSSLTDEYRSKLRTAEGAAALVKSGDWIDYAFFNGKPVAFDRALAARKEELQDICIFTAVSLLPVPEVILKDPKGEVFTYMDHQWSPLTRIVANRRPNVFYSPTQFGESETWYETKAVDPDKIGTRYRDVFVIRTAPMDNNGYFNFGLHNAIAYMQAICSAKLIVEVNPNMPVALGGAKEQIHISKVDCII
jgi:acyl-CoA hydrolase